MTPHPALEAYRTKVERLLQTTDRLLQATDSNRPVPPVLYHYTDAHGLYGIAQTKELWATNVSYLNDSQESPLWSWSSARVYQEICTRLTDLQYTSEGPGLLCIDGGPGQR